MTMIRDLGKLLISIDNAVLTVFGDDAFVTDISPSSYYDSEGVLLRVTISVLADRYTSDILDSKMYIFDELVYNPLFNSDNTLSKVDIFFQEV